MTDSIEDAGGILGNFERRRKIEEEVGQSKPVGRTHPRELEATPGSRTWSELHTQERLLDEEG